MEWERELLQQFREGRPSALAAVYRAHAEGLARLVRAMAWRDSRLTWLRSALELEGVVGEVFFRAFEPRARGAYDGVRPYKAFLAGIARNVVLEYSRRREVATGLEPHAGQPEGWEPPEGLEYKVEDQEVAALLSRFQQELSLEERQLFTLRYEEEEAQEAVAERLGLTRVQVRRRELNLKKRLLAFLQARGYLEGLELHGWGLFKRRGAA